MHFSIVRFFVCTNYCVLLIFRARFMFSPNETQAALKISNLQLSDEGVYRCEITYLEINEGCPVVQYVNLTVLGIWWLLVLFPPPLLLLPLIPLAGSVRLSLPIAYTFHHCRLSIDHVFPFSLLLVRMMEVAIFLYSAVHCSAVVFSGYQLHLSRKDRAIKGAL